MDYLNLKSVTAKPTINLKKEDFMVCGTTKIYWLAGAGFLINARGTIVLVDPVLKTMPGHPEKCETGPVLKIKYPIDPDNIPKVDVVLYTHSDDDHLGKITPQSLCRLKPKMIGPPPAFEKLARMHIDIDLLVSCRSKDTLHYPNVDIEVFPADHPWQLMDPEHLDKPFRNGDAVGYLIKTPDVYCFFPGDTRLMEDHLYLKGKGIQFLVIDVSLCTYHLNPMGARTLSNLLEDAYLMPYHYGTFVDQGFPAFCGDPATVLDEVKNGYDRALVTAPGESVEFKSGKLVSKA
jgi:L-ascorbate metabolism protein UlaG (beta-lactamase superfamily)